MKTLAKTFILAVLATFCVVIFSCDKNKDDYVKPKCLITSIEMSYEEYYEGETYSGTDMITLSYDNDSKLIKFKWEDDNDELRFVYGTDGKLSKIEYWENNILDEYGQFTWVDNTVELIWFEKEGGTFVEDDWKTVYHMDDNNEITLVEDYDKEDGNWVKYWYLQNTWQNGNITKQEAYDTDYWYKNNGVKNEKLRRISVFKRNKKVETKRSSLPDRGTKEFTKYRTTTFTYDTKNNPFSPHPGLNFLEGGEAMFLSKNNILSETRTYHDDNDVRTDNYTYQYNQENFPSSMTYGREYSADDWWTETWVFSYLCD
jgi:hypothetical protein